MTPHLLLTGCYNVRIVELLFVRLGTFEMRCMSVFAQNCIFRLVYMAAYISACCAGWSLVFFLLSGLHLIDINFVISYGRWDKIYVLLSLLISVHDSQHLMKAHTSKVSASCRRQSFHHFKTVQWNCDKSL